MYDEKIFLDACNELGIVVVKVDKLAMPLVNDVAYTFADLRCLFDFGKYNEKV